MLPVGQIGVGDVALALVPTINLLVIAVVYKMTGRTREQLVGQTEQLNEQVESSQQVIQTDLRNGIRDRLDRVERKLDHILRKEKNSG